MIQLPDLGQILLTALINSISGLIANIFYIILFVWGIKMLVKNIPNWIKEYDNIKVRERTISQAKAGMGEK